MNITNPFQNRSKGQNDAGRNQESVDYLAWLNRVSSEFTGEVEIISDNKSGFSAK